MDFIAYSFIVAESDKSKSEGMGFTPRVSRQSCGGGICRNQSQVQVLE